MSTNHDIVLRPVLKIELLGPGLAPDDPPPRVAALVDSGAERTFAAPWLARAIGVDLHGAPEIRVGLGGASRRVQFAEVTLRLIAPDESAAIEWQADVGRQSANGQPRSGTTPKVGNGEAPPCQRCTRYDHAHQRKCSPPRCRSAIVRRRAHTQRCSW